MLSKAIAIALAVAGAPAANAWALAPAPSLRSGETRWFVAGRLHVGETIRCTQGGATIAVKVPAAASGADTYSRTLRAGRRIAVEIERHMTERRRSRAERGPLPRVSRRRCPTCSVRTGSV